MYKHKLIKKTRLNTKEKQKRKKKEKEGLELIP